MEDNGWTYGEREDVLALGKQPVAPANATTNVGTGHLGRTKAGKRREKAITAEQENLKRAQKMAASQGQGQGQKQKCRSCQNRRRKCDSVRPVCGTCRERNIPHKCGYNEVSTKDPDTTAPSSPGGESLNASESSAVAELDASAPAASTNPSNPSYTPRPQTDASSMPGGPTETTKVTQPTRQGLKRERKRKQALDDEEDSAEEQPNKRYKLTSRLNH